MALAGTALPRVVLCAEVEHAGDGIEEIIVSSTLQQSRADTVLPVNILAGEELREKLGATLGETLQNEIGVNIASFGPGVGAPIIRGQGSNRVQILQSGIGNIDASAISPDHANSLEPALAERIEVVRGPSTLLYGNGAVGGVVNVIDNRIPTNQFNGINGLLESRYSSAADQQISVLKLEGGVSNFAWHVDGVYRESNDVEVNGFAINPASVGLGQDEFFQALLRSKGHIDNSSTQADSSTLGGSWLLDSGHIGLSVNRVDNEYGIPAGVPDEDGGGEEDVRIVMEQERADFELQIPLTGFLKEIRGRVGAVDYQHVEVESNGDVGTRVEQDGVEGRFTFHLNTPGNFEGVTGIQFSLREFLALGEEAFIPKTDIDSFALFTVHSLDRGALTHEFGIRGERQSLDQVNGACGEAETSWSGSASSVWRFREDTNLIVSLSHSQRMATVEELYSNIATNCGELAIAEMVEHAATQRLEVGNPRSVLEKSTNIELGLRKHLGNVTGEFNLFYNSIADYIYLFDSGLYNAGTEIARYLQEDAIFTGFEAELSVPLLRTGDHVSDITVFSDFVRARFDHAGNVPRIPALRAGLEYRHSHVNWQAKIRLAEGSDQNNHGVNETPTSGYTMLNFYADYHLQWPGQTALVFIKGTNLLDENIRHHASLLKDVAPVPGRSWEIGLRLEF